MLNGELMYLRAMEPLDVDLLYEWENDPQVWVAGTNTKPLSKTDIQAFVDHTDLDIYQTKQLRLMIIEKSTDVAVGCIDLFDFDPFNMHGGIGVLVCEKYRGKGFAKEAIKVFSQYLFDTYALHTIGATMSADNEVSQGLFEACGYQYCGIRRGWLRRGDRFLDEVVYQKMKV